MTTEEKDLLLKDLCGRLPYETKINCGTVKPFHTLQSVWVDNEYNVVNITDDFGLTFNIDEVKSYLRPMSSMTEEEKEYIKNRWCYEDWNDIHNFLNHYQIDAGDAFSFVDWLNSHNFDYRGLIVKRLALEAPEDMYKKN